MMKKVLERALRPPHVSHPGGAVGQPFLPFVRQSAGARASAFRQGIRPLIGNSLDSHSRDSTGHPFPRAALLGRFRDLLSKRFLSFEVVPLPILDPSGKRQRHGLGDVSCITASNEHLDIFRQGRRYHRLDLLRVPGRCFLVEISVYRFPDYVGEALEASALANRFEFPKVFFGQPNIETCCACHCDRGALYDKLSYTV